MNPAIGPLNSPILVWMLYVNHEITEEVRDSVCGHDLATEPTSTRNTKSASKLSPRLYPTVSISSTTTGPENQSVRLVLLLPIGCATDRLFVRRCSSRKHDAAAHDAPPTNPAFAVARP